MAGIQQAWGFAWKSLLTGELIVAATRSSGLGHLLDEHAADVPTLLAVLAVIVVIGVAVDYLVIGLLDRRIRTRRGLLPSG
jgi:NitT/TauT family transport system permease protein